MKSGVTSMDIDPVRSCYLATASCTDPVVRVFDRRMISDDALGKSIVQIISMWIQSLDFQFISYSLPCPLSMIRIPNNILVI